MEVVREYMSSKVDEDMVRDSLVWRKILMVDLQLCRIKAKQRNKGMVLEKYENFYKSLVLYCFLNKSASRYVPKQVEGGGTISHYHNVSVYPKK